MPSRTDNPRRWCFGVFAAGVIVAGALASLFGTPDLAEARTNRGLAEEIVLFVDDDAPAGGGGLTWDSAFECLQDALDAARQPDSGVTEIRVAGGAYKADQGASVTPGDVNASFDMVSGLALRGGYAGHWANPADPDKRDFTLYETRLSGDLLENDGPAFSWLNYEDNTLHILKINDASPSTLVEGLTITASNADFDAVESFGGGIRCVGGALTIAHCVLRLNEGYFGGGFSLEDSDATLTHCRIELNRAMSSIGKGGGGWIEGGHIVIEDTDFTSNYCVYGDEGGLGVLADSAVISRCNFLNNGAGDRGGGAGAGPNVTFIDCNFVGNNAAVEGGGLWGGTLRIRCNFIDNYAGQFGGGLRGAAVSIGCLFEDNATGFEGGGGAAGGGTFINCEFRSNDSDGNATGGGGGMWVRSTPGATFVGCVFNTNTTEGPGGGVFVNPGLNASFSNCTFVGNFSKFGVGGAVAGQGAMNNCVLWNNSPSGIDGKFAVAFSCVQGGWPGSGNTGVNPQFVNAAGADGINGNADDDLRLSSGSPCIDAGHNGLLPPDQHDLDHDGNAAEPLPIDFLDGLRVRNDPNTPNTGLPRGAQTIVDMGAIEFADFRPLAGDANDDGVVNVDDLIAAILGWGECEPSEDCPGDVNGDGNVDVSDLILIIENWT